MPLEDQRCDVIMLQEVFWFLLIFVGRKSTIASTPTERTSPVVPIGLETVHPRLRNSDNDIE